MKYSNPEISWHNRDPVLSIDFQPQSSDGLLRLATGGSQGNDPSEIHVIVMWSLTVGQNGAGSVEFLCELNRHEKSVNTVRFSPNGEMLASADDGGIIMIWMHNYDWKPKSDISDFSAKKDSEPKIKEQWTVRKVLRGHLGDVCDMCWSPDGSKLLSGSVDNTAILWDVIKGKRIQLLSEQDGFVQGVAWDPKNKFVATLSSDRSCRVYSLLTKKVETLNSVLIKNADGEEKPQHLFHDDTLMTFCRRLNFSPDGRILFAPCGLLELDEVTTTDDSEPTKKKKKIYTTYAFVRCDHFSKPVAHYPSDDGYSVAVRCCPILFELKPGQPSLFDIPYRMVFVVATEKSILLYDTQEKAPFARISRIHYTRLTDVAWSSNGRILVVSSMDGYCSIVTFSDGELGKPYENVECVEEAVSPNLLSSFQTLLQGETFHENFQPVIDDEDFHLAYEVTEMTPDTPAAPCPPTHSTLNSECSTAQESPICVNVRNSPRRVKLVTLSSPKK